MFRPPALKGMRAEEAILSTESEVMKGRIHHCEKTWLEK